MTKRRRGWKEFPLNGENERLALSSVVPFLPFHPHRAAIDKFAIVTDMTTRQARSMFRYAGIPYRDFQATDSPFEPDNP